jgi:competence protein ComEC
VAVLYWGISRWFYADADPLQQLLDESRPGWERGLRWLGRTVVVSYAVTAACWLAVTPLVAARYHLVSLAGLVIGPPVVLLTSIALLAGFLLLLVAVACWPLVPLFAWIVHASLAGCEFLVRGSDRLSVLHYTGDIPEAWLWLFYLGLLAALVLEPLRRRWDLAALAGLAWVCLGLVAASARPAPDALRCTFLAVGHGGCTVIETPEGRTLLYDAGALGGPDVTRRQIAPYLWHRGIRRIDEIFLSHADLDHFNGLIGLSERFPIAQVTCTPTFEDKPIRAVALTLDTLEQKRIPRRIARAGDRLTSGSLALEVLHPPANGPDGPENARSLVLLLRHAGHTILLTGDLEKEGLERVLQLPAPTVDVLMAPHHGSRTANTPELAAWAHPRLVVACQGPPRGPARQHESYRAQGAAVLGTWPHGAISIKSHANGLWVTTFRSKLSTMISSEK